MTSLGNVEASHLASLTVVSFTSGDIVYLTGVATNIVGEEAQALMPRQNVLTSIQITGYVMVKDALPVRQKPDTIVQRSPYSPPIKLLREEQLNGQARVEIDAQASLVRIDLHSPTIATFTWKPSATIRSQPGQAVVLDFSKLFGKPSYRHMAPDNPFSINDDRIRTWTLTRNDDATFSVTLRRRPGGLVTGGLFSIAAKLVQHRPELLENTTQLGLTADIRGVSGEFILPSAEKLLWVAGGIGITPFLRMLSSIDERERKDIILIVSTREPDVILDLISSAASRSKPPPLSTLRIHIFSHSTHTDSARKFQGWNTQVEFSVGRITPEIFHNPMFQGRTAMICGPRSFESDVIGGMSRVGITGIQRENFEY
jgi:ferredoxin-NADP reductase